MAIHLNVRMRLLCDSTLLQWLGLAKDGMDPLTGFSVYRAASHFARSEIVVLSPAPG